MTRFSISLLALILALGLSVPATSQIVSEELGAAKAFDAGALSRDDGALDAALWQSTTAAEATALIQVAPISTDNAVVRDMIRRVLLSGGAPPEGAGRAYQGARLAALQAVTSSEDMQTLITRSPELAADRTLQADMALSEGEFETACQLSDTQDTDRGAVYWLRLRALCHISRDEGNAADLTVQLLRDAGYADAPWLRLVSSMALGVKPKIDDFTPKDTLGRVALDLARATTDDDTADELDPYDKLLVTRANMTDATFEQALNVLAYPVGTDGQAQTFDYNSAAARTDDVGKAQIHLLARTDNGANGAQALAHMMSKSPDYRDLAKSRMASLPDGALALAVNDFAPLAVEAGDLGVLQKLYSGLAPSDPRRDRIALASDALGQGFAYRPMGQYIDTRAKAGRLDDAIVALGLGAQISPDVAAAIAGQSEIGPSVSEGDMILMELAAADSSQAETVLRAAALLDQDELNIWDMRRILSTLRAVGLPDMAGKIAAQQFLSDISVDE